MSLEGLLRELQEQDLEKRPADRLQEEDTVMSQG